METYPTCPLSLKCPSCIAGPGQKCVRPSEHKAPDPHATRIQLASEIDERNIPDHPYSAPTGKGDACNVCGGSPKRPQHQGGA